MRVRFAEVFTLVPSDSTDHVMLAPHKKGCIQSFKNEGAGGVLRNFKGEFNLAALYRSL